MSKLLRALAVAATLIPSVCLAQGQVNQTGSVTTGHAVKWFADQTIGDAGPATGGNSNVGITALPIVGLGTPLCIYDSPTTNALGYHSLCFGSNSNGNAVMVINSAGGATPNTFKLVINGSTLDIPFVGQGSGNVVGPNSSTLGGLVCWNNTQGTLLADCVGNAIPLVPVTPPSNPATGWMLYDDTNTGTVNLKSSSGVTVPLSSPQGPLFTNVVKFSNPGPGTWVVPAGVYWIYVEEWGGGGGSTDADPGNIQPIAGAGSGSYANEIVSVTPGQNINYVVGAGGAFTNYGNTGLPGGSTVWNNGMTASGGHGSSYTAVGTGGVATGGQINLAGSVGASYSFGPTPNSDIGGNGGSAPRGSGGGVGFNGGCTAGEQPGGGAGGPGTGAITTGCNGGAGLIYVRY